MYGKSHKDLRDDCQSRISYFPEAAIYGLTLPDRFTFPFYYEPHPLARIAATELQQYLETQGELNHNFGLNDEQEGMVIGKMFGVLVVQDKKGQTGYLAAFSGKLAGTNHHPKFVPPVFDMLTENSFFLQEQEQINGINDRLEAILSNSNYQQLKQDIEALCSLSSEEISTLKQTLKANKGKRDTLRNAQKDCLNPQDYTQLEAACVQQSLYDKRQLRDLVNKWEQILDSKRANLAVIEQEIEALKQERKERSAKLQQTLFEQYRFLNKEGKQKSLREIFSRTAFGQPPSAAGECATPKLLQFAFANGYRPLAMAEFWWGASPKSEIRQHKQFYPACTGKCKPILAHMLEGIALEDNPFLRMQETGNTLEIVYEDDSFVVVNKPYGLRSVPGVDISDSVYSRLQHLLAGVEPLIIHRLDMDTSGLLVVAKTPKAHKHIQKQFLQRGVKKRYRAIVTARIEHTEGEIRLPLRPDPFDRPRQLVCFETGKTSVTKWKVVASYETRTRLDFWPLTGRTHQLRMHSAHPLGLNAPIVGDDLYGKPAERMYLHAAQLEFVHPETKKTICFEVKEEF